MFSHLTISNIGRHGSYGYNYAKRYFAEFLADRTATQYDRLFKSTQLNFIKTHGSRMAKRDTGK